MSYILQWRTPAIPGKTAVTVPVGTVISNAASVRFTGKGAANYGAVEQQNLMNLLENFAGPTAPDFPTIGQTWFDSSTSTLKVYADNAPSTWKALGGVQVLPAVDGPPANPQVGDLWFEATGPLSGYLYVYNGLGRFPYSTSTNGGWSQVWPLVDRAGLRQEYDQVASMSAFIATNASFLTGRLFTQLPDFTALDADLETKRASTPDPEVNLTSVTGLQAQPVSYDWDALLSMARWQVARLDLPTDAWQDISFFPFVQDGRQVRPYLLQDYSFFDPRYTPDERRASRPLGSITLHRLYAETVNLLSVAQSFRYTLRGMAGASGTNATFSPDVASSLHCRRAGNWAGGGSVVANTLFRWSNGTDRDRWIAGASAVEITVRLVGGAGASNVALASFLDSIGRIRVTADLVRWMDSSATPLMTVAPTSPGLLAVTGTAGPVALGSQTVGANTLTLSGERTTEGFNLTVTVIAPGGITGNLQVTYGLIHDRTTFDVAEQRLYPAPLAYNSGIDSIGTSGILANQVLAAAPTANFTVNGGTGPAPVSVGAASPVAFVFTGTGSPTLIEWDFDGDGTFTATGASVNHTYGTSGVYSPRVRVSNAVGTDVLFRPGKVVAN